MFAFGGAVTVHLLVAPVEEQLKAGNIVRAPMALPCVDDEAAMSETRMVEVVPWKRVTSIAWVLP